MKRVVFCVAFAAFFGMAASAATAQTLNTIKQRGSLNCGANGTLAGFGLPDAQGRWAGLDVDFCKALAAAIFNDPNKVKFVPLTAKDRFTALQSGEVDVLARNTTWTSSRDTSLGSQLYRRELLRRPGLPGAQGAQGQFGARAQRRRDLRAAGHHDGAQPRGLLPRQQDEAQDRDVRDRGRGAEGLRLQAAATPTPRTRPASPASGCVSPTPATTSSCRRSSRRSRSVRWCVTATINGSTS